MVAGAVIDVEIRIMVVVWVCCSAIRMLLLLSLSIFEDGKVKSAMRGNRI